MTFSAHASLFAPGLLLLLFPADRLLSSVIELRSFAFFHRLENSPGHQRWWRVPLLWLDPLRGFAGAWLLTAPLRETPTSWAALPKPAYALVAAMLAASVVCQLPTRRDRTALLAPVGFVAGMVVALVPWTVSLLGLTLATTAMLGFRQYHAFFTVGLFTVCGLGFAFRAEVPWLIPAVVVLALPIMASVATGRSLELPVRNSSARRSTG